jgi:hypothetical protein
MSREHDTAASTRTSIRSINREEHERYEHGTKPAASRGMSSSIKHEKCQQHNDGGRSTGASGALGCQEHSQPALSIQRG